MTPKKPRLVLAVIDGCKPAMLDRAVAEGQAPFLADLIARGTYVPECVAAFPSVTPVCAATIATGVRQDRHRIPAMNWYSRQDERYVEYGSSFSASRRFGIARQLQDTIYNMNGEHLPAEELTVFERLDDAGVRTAGTTYLFYRGRHEHHVTRESALSRLASTVIRRPVMGPQELFYADLFASQETGCRGTLGMPGQRDQHTGCVGAHLLEHDLCDFLLFSLPDNDTRSHKLGIPAMVGAIANADAQLRRLADAWDGDFLADWAVIVVADHSHAPVESAIAWQGAFDGVLAPNGRNAEEAHLAFCPSQRSAQVYVLDPSERAQRLPGVVDTALAIEGVDVACFRSSSGEAVVARAGGGELRFSPGPHVRDARGVGWSVDGDLDVLESTIDDGVWTSAAYPDALARVWAAVTCPTSGDVLLSAAPGWEFPDWGGVDHVGAGSHGALHALDSNGALVFHGVEPPEERRRDNAWSIADLTPMVLGHFGLPSAA